MIGRKGGKFCGKGCLTPTTSDGSMSVMNQTDQQSMSYLVYNQSSTSQVLTSFTPTYVGESTKRLIEISLAQDSTISSSLVSSNITIDRTMDDYKFTMETFAIETRYFKGFDSACQRLSFVAGSASIMQVGKFRFSSPLEMVIFLGPHADFALSLAVWIQAKTMFWKTADRYSCSAHSLGRPTRG